MPIRTLTTMLTALMISGCAITQHASPHEDHSAQHPPGVAPAAAATQPAPDGAPSTQAYDRQMNAMQEMHLRMRAAKTPAERAALMSEHRQLMQAGMSMMGAMHGRGKTGAPAGRSPQGGMGMQGMAGMMNMHTQIERRVAMMEQMMQMMVDREAVLPRE